MSRPIHTYSADELTRATVEANRHHPPSVRVVRVVVAAPIFALLFAGLGYGFSLLWTHFGPTWAFVIGGALYGASTAWESVDREWKAQRKAFVEEALWLDTTVEGKKHFTRLSSEMQRDEL